MKKSVDGALSDLIKGDEGGFHPEEAKDSSEPKEKTPEQEAEDEVKNEEARAKSLTGGKAMNIRTEMPQNLIKSKSGAVMISTDIEKGRSDSSRSNPGLLYTHDDFKKGCSEKMWPAKKEEKKDEKPKPAEKSLSEEVLDIFKDVDAAFVAGDLNKAYEGFQKLSGKLKGKVDDPDAVAATVGKKKYGDKAFQAASAAGKKMKSDGEVDLAKALFKEKMAECMPLDKKCEKTKQDAIYSALSAVSDLDKLKDVRYHIEGELSESEKATLEKVYQSCMRKLKDAIKDHKAAKKSDSLADLADSIQKARGEPYCKTCGKGEKGCKCGDSKKSIDPNSLATVRAPAGDLGAALEKPDTIKAFGDENLKNTHGEQFHSDADRQVIQYLTTIDQIQMHDESHNQSPNKVDPNQPLHAQERSMLHNVW